MNEKQMAGKARLRAEITDKLAAFPPAVQGKICSCTKVCKSGKEVTYHNLQYQMNGKHHTILIPEDRLPEFEAAVESGKIAKELPPLRTLLRSERIEEFFRCRVVELPQVRFAV